MKEPQYTLADFSIEEAKEITEALTAILSKHNGQFYINQFIKAGKIEAELQVLKKVELIPKETGIPSPFVPNGENNTQAEPDTTTETSS